MPKVVVDANVLVSTLFGGTPRKAYLKALGTCEVYVSPEIRNELLLVIDELPPVLGPARVRRLRAIISRLLSPAHEITPAKRIELSRDKKDNAYLSLCLAARADILLTGDRDLLDIPSGELKRAGLNRLSIVSPARFLAEKGKD